MTIMLVLLVSAVIAASPCSYFDIVHYNRAQQYHDHASDTYDRFETERDDCDCACGACAIHVVALAKESLTWAIREQAELNSISPSCREALNAETPAQ